MQQGNEEEMFSDVSLKSNNKGEDDTLLSIRGKKRRKFKIDLKNKNNFFIPFLISCIVLEFYFGLTFFFSTSISDKMQLFINEMNVTCILESYFSFANNV